MKKLPVFATVGDVWDSPFSNFARLFPVYFASQVLVYIGVFFLIRSADTVQSFQAALIVYWLTFVLVTTAVVVYQHRVIGGAPRPGAVVGPTLKYLLALVVLGLLTGLAMALLMIPAGIISVGAGGGVSPGSMSPVAGVAFAIAGLLGMLVGARLSLMLPAAALGEGISPRRAWRRMTGSTIRFILAYICLAIVVLIFVAPVTWLVSMIFDVPLAPEPPAEPLEGADPTAAALEQMKASFGSLSVPYAVINIVIGYFVAVMSVSILTHAYLYLKENDQAPAG